MGATEPGTKVLLSEDGRGNSTLALRAFAKGEVLSKEPPLALVYPSDDTPWMKDMRKELMTLSEACAWQYCVAVQCLAEEDLKGASLEGFTPMAPAARTQMEELCGTEFEGDLESSELAHMAAKHLLGAFRTASVSPIDLAALRRRLDELAARISRNGFQIMDLSRRPPTSADGLFHRISFCNHCCAGLNNASWTWDGAERMLSLKATRDIAAGEELTISYIAKPWSDLAKPARQRYLQQNFNFTCLCKACTLPPAEEEALRQKLAEQRTEKPAGKLGDMLMRWMQDGKQVCDAEPDEGEKKEQTEVAPKKDEPKRPLTDEDRIARVLKRCEGEEMEVSREDAETALAAEEGHVGKTMIRLRRQRRDAAAAAAAGESTAPAPVPKTDDAAVVGPSGSCTPASYAVATLAAIAIGAVLLTRQRLRK